MAQCVVELTIRQFKFDNWWIRSNCLSIQDAMRRLLSHLVGQWVDMSTHFWIKITARLISWKVNDRLNITEHKLQTGYLKTGVS